MDYENIDASLGLTFSLEAFRQYRKTGILQARVRSIPGMRGGGTAYLHLKDGIVVSCYVESDRGVQAVVSPETLCQVDQERGPFDWTLHLHHVDPVPPQMIQPFSPASEQKHDKQSMPGALADDTSIRYPGNAHSPSLSGKEPLHDNAIPRIVNTLSWELLDHWPLQQKQVFFTIWSSIDGKSSVQMIKMRLQIQSALVEDALRLLLNWNIITLS